jgi:hypothetical protein
VAQIVRHAIGIRETSWSMVHLRAIEIRRRLKGEIGTPH